MKQATKFALLSVVAVAFLVGSTAGSSDNADTPLWQCSKGVRSIPGNVDADNVNDAKCATCNYNTRNDYPCNRKDMCICKGVPIPEKYQTRFFSCSKVITTGCPSGSSECATNAQCSVCNNGARRWWPCEDDTTLCKCAPSAENANNNNNNNNNNGGNSGNNNGGNGGGGGNNGGQSGSCTTDTADTPLWQCSKGVRSIPGNVDADNVNDAKCAACNHNTRNDYPCNRKDMCICKGVPIPEKYRTKYFTCNKVVTSGCPSGSSECATNAQCSACNNGARRWWPCDKNLCKCAAGATNNAYTGGSQSCGTSGGGNSGNGGNNNGGGNNGNGGNNNGGGNNGNGGNNNNNNNNNNGGGNSNGGGDVNPTPEPPSGPYTPPTHKQGNTMRDFKYEAAPACLDMQHERASQYSCGFSYKQALCMSMAFYMAQAGGKVDTSSGNPVNPGQWRRDCYTKDGGNSKNLTLGWFDAGDYIKFGVPLAYSANSLAWGALEFPGGYKDPRIKRALTYNLRQAAFYLMEAWDNDKKEFVVQISRKSEDHGSWTPCKDRANTVRSVYKATRYNAATEPAADAASALAAIALALKKLEEKDSESLQKRAATVASQLFSFADTYRRNYNQLGIATDTYSSSGYTDNLAFAATWMHEVKQKGLVSSSVDYLGKAKSTYGKPGYIGWNHDWDNRELGICLRLFQFTRDKYYSSQIIGQIDKFRNGHTWQGNRQFGTTSGGLLKVNEWGNLRHASNAGFVARVAAKLGVGTDSQRATLRAFAKRQLDYVLGKNPADRSYVVGFGKNPPVQPHHRSAADIGEHDSRPNRHTIYGALVGGPFHSDNDYADKRNDYRRNEVAIDYNALFSGLLAAHNQDETNLKKSSWCGQVTIPTTPKPTPKPAAPTPKPVAPTPKPAASDGNNDDDVKYKVKVVGISRTKLNVKVSPKPAKVVFNYNNNKKQCTAKFSNGAWRCTVAKSAKVGNGAIRALIYTSATKVARNVLIKEGGIKVTAKLRLKSNTWKTHTFAQLDSAARFDTNTFPKTVAAGLGIAPERVSLLQSTPAADGESFDVEFAIAAEPIEDFDFQNYAPAAVPQDAAAAVAAYAEMDIEEETAENAAADPQSTSHIAKEFQSFAAQTGTPSAAPVAYLLRELGAEPSSIQVSPENGETTTGNAPEESTEDDSGIECNGLCLAAGSVGSLIFAVVGVALLSLIVVRARKIRRAATDEESLEADGINEALTAVVEEEPTAIVTSDDVEDTASSPIEETD